MCYLLKWNLHFRYIAYRPVIDFRVDFWFTLRKIWLSFGRVRLALKLQNAQGIIHNIDLNRTCSTFLPLRRLTVIYNSTGCSCRSVHTSSRGSWSCHTHMSRSPFIQHKLHIGINISAFQNHSPVQETAQLMHVWPVAYRVIMIDILPTRVSGIS